jgi:hypothetical protein
MNSSPLMTRHQTQCGPKTAQNLFLRWRSKMHNINALRLPKIHLDCLSDEMVISYRVSRWQGYAL